MLLPTQEASRISCINPCTIDIFCNDCACADNGIVANCNRHNCGIGSYRHIIAYMRCMPQRYVATCRASAGKTVVYEHHPMANEAVRANCNQFAYKTMTLNSRSILDDDALLNFAKGSDEAIVADLAFIYVGGRNDRGPCPEIHFPDDRFKNFVRRMRQDQSPILPSRE